MTLEEMCGQVAGEWVNERRTAFTSGCDVVALVGGKLGFRCKDRVHAEQEIKQRMETPSGLPVSTDSVATDLGREPGIDLVGVGDSEAGSQTRIRSFAIEAGLKANGPAQGEYAEPPTEKESHSSLSRSEPSSHQNTEPMVVGQELLKQEIRADYKRAYELVLKQELRAKAGGAKGELYGWCPFHNDGNDPNFRLNPAKGLWRCDPCGQGGDIFNLAGRLRNEGFKATAAWLTELLALGSYRNGHSKQTPTPNPPARRDRKLVRTIRYEVKDLAGVLKATHLRHEYDDGSKSMPWEPAGIKTTELPLYGTEWLAKARAGDAVIVCEGEKDAQSLNGRDLTIAIAVGTVSGASGTPCDASLEPLGQFDVYLWPDNDEPGRLHMERIGARLLELGHERLWRIDWKEAPDKGGAADFSGSLQELMLAAVPVESTNRLVIPWESFDAAVIANEEYLKRAPVIDKLCYSHAVSMITGGKHAGKSTLARWMAICVVKGWPFLGREVIQEPVLYVASEDETMAARQELIRLGWTQDDELRFLSFSNVPNVEESDFFAALAKDIKRMSAGLVIVDMLFDLVRIGDEMSYAGTRQAVGVVQTLASDTGSHVVVIHHAPKNAQIGDATVAALGSQGLAARVSPIILVRRFGPGVHSISSTGVRDPRGESIMESRLTRNDDGSVQLGGAWKNYMLAEVYMERVRELLDAEPDAEMTAGDVVDNLQITYEVARSCLSLMWKQGLAHRTGQGKKGKPFRYSSIIESNDLPETQNTPHGEGEVGKKVIVPEALKLDLRQGESHKQNLSRSWLPKDDDDLDEYGISKSK